MLMIKKVQLTTVLLALFAAGVVSKSCFTYFEEDSELGRGLGQWNKCSKSEAYFPWGKFLNSQGNNNCLDRRSSSSGHRQSPINIQDWKQCVQADNDDNHRHWTQHGNCTLNNVTFDIKPWGLLMTWPIPASGQNPETNPCVKPSVDSSGGYPLPFYANYLSLVSPSEHQINGVQYDAEINIAHFIDGTDIPMIFSVLAKADDSYPDNPALEPFLREWEQVHARTRQLCEPDMKHCSTTAIQLETGYLQQDKTTGNSNDGKGIMFDLVAPIEYDLVIKAFDVNVRSQSSSNLHTFRVYIRRKGNSGGSHIGYETNSLAWSEISRVPVFGMGAHQPSRLTLERPILLPKGQTLGFYIVHVNDDDQYNGNVGSLLKGDVLKFDGMLTVLVGSALGGPSSNATDFTEVKPNRGFSGNVYYSVCVRDGSSYLITDPSNKAGLAVPYTVERLSGNGYNYLGCFRTGGDRMSFVGSGLTSSECADKCRDLGKPFFVKRDGGACYCTDGEYSYNGQADKCECGSTDMVVGYNKQCVFSVMLLYMGCFANSPSEDAFEVKISGLGGLSLVKCEEACRDAGFRFMGRQWKGSCYCSNQDNYYRYGARGNCACEAENVGSLKFCAYDLGFNIPPLKNIRDNPNYSSQSRQFKGCFNDSGDRALPIYVGQQLSDNQCAERCFARNHQFFGIQFRGQCYCGDGDYERYGPSDLCRCGKNNKGVWVICTYEFVPINQRSLLSNDKIESDRVPESLEPPSTTSFKNESLRALWSVNQAAEIRESTQKLASQFPDDETQYRDSTAKSSESKGLMQDFSEIATKFILVDAPDQPATVTRDGGPRDKEWGPFNWAFYPEFDVYRLLTTPWFYRYLGSYTKPLCYDYARWRVFKEPLQISLRQKVIIDELIKEMTDPSTCKKSTVGKPRYDGTDRVNVNRPIQTRTSSHQLYLCDSDYWKSQGFYNTPRGNTNWKILEDKALFVDDSHWGNI